ncbi:MAG: histidine phosphatase family protein [Eubacterium sp.]|nr:histidine phosphatase family protein [Eubacterium sp.]
MTVFLARHGNELGGFRGGWSSHGLDEIGIQQATALAEYLVANQSVYNIQKIYSSDLTRATQTAKAVADRLGLPVIEKSGYREVNNGDLAGMANDEADRLYPNLYWKGLGWEEKYPNGESPKDFYGRISAEWKSFLSEIRSEDKNVLLITHGGVIQVILSILKGERYSNRKSFGSVSCCDLIKIEM